MKIQLDTTNKTITIEEDVNLHDFYEELNSLLPGGLWREFSLKISSIRNWENPITITPNPTIGPNIWGPTRNSFPPVTPTHPQIWYTTGTDNISLNDGIYNITTKA